MKMTAGQRWVLALTSLAGLMIMLDALVVSTALHAIQLDLHAPLGALEWTINAYNLSFAVLLMAGAALGDRYGRRRVLASGSTVFTLASTGCALAPNLGWLIAARTAQGIGAAAIMPVAVALLSAAFEPAQRTRALGLFAATTGLGTLGGPLLGGAVVQGMTWQWIFWINVPIGVLLVPLVRTRLPESFGLAGRLDYVGIALVSIAAFGLVWGLIRGNESGWAGTEVVTAFVIGVAALAGFIRWESHTTAPLIPMGFFASRAFSAGNAAGLLLTASIFSGAFFFTQFLRVVKHYGPLGAGLRLAPWTVTLFLVAVADLLGTSPAAINSALQRAHAHLEKVAPMLDQMSESLSPRERVAVDRYMHFFGRSDMRGLAELLRDDVVMEMPPALVWFAGRADVLEFFTAKTCSDPGRWRCVGTAANTQPATACYQRDDEGIYRAQSIHVLTVKDAGIGKITVFLGSQLFERFGLPATLE